MISGSLKLWGNSALSYLIHTSPLSDALLIRQVFESPMVSGENRDVNPQIVFIKRIG